MKTLKAPIAIAALALLGGCVAVPVAPRYGYAPPPGVYVYRPAPPVYYGPAVDIRFDYGRGWRGYRR